MAELNPFAIQHIAAGVVRECSADGTIYIYNVDNNSPLTIKSWGANVKEVLSLWPANSVCLLMHDLHKIGQSAFDRPMTDMLDELYSTRPELERNIAYISPNTDIIANLFITSHLLNVNGNNRVHWKLFDSRREGINWLIKLRNERQ